MLRLWPRHLLRRTQQRQAFVPVPGKWVADANKLKQYFRDHEGFLSHYTRRDTIGRTAQLGWGKPELDVKEIRTGVKMAFEQVVTLLEQKDWSGLKELFRDDEISQRHAQQVIDSWKTFSKSDQELLGRGIMDNVAITASCFKRNNATCKNKKSIIADIHMRCMLIADLKQLPESVVHSESDQLQKMVHNHDKLIKENGCYYMVFYIELKHHFGTQDKQGWTPGSQQWQLYSIQSWPL